MPPKDMCERCGTKLGEEIERFACSYGCTFCAACAQQMHYRCPNCGGVLSATSPR